MKTVTRNVLTVQLGHIIYVPGRVKADFFRKLSEIPMYAPFPHFYRKWKGKVMFFPIPTDPEALIISEHRETYEL